MSMFPTVVLYLHPLVFFLNTGLAWIVILARKKSWQNRFFAIYAVSLALWNASLFFTITGIGGPAAQLWWSRLAFSFYFMMINSFFYFALMYNRAAFLPRRFNFLFWGGTALLFILTLTPWLVAGDIKIVDGFITGKLGPLISFFSWYYVLFIASSIVVLIWKLTRVRGLDKVKLRYVLAGFSLFAIPMILTNMVLPVFWGIFRYNNLGPLFSFPMLAVIGYAIVRHRLMDIRVVIQRGLLYTTLLGIIVAFYLSLVGIFGYFFKELTHMTAIISAALTAIVGILGAPAVEKYFRRFTDKIFFKDAYDYSQAMHELSEILNNGIEGKAIIAESSQLLKKIFKAKTAEIFVGQNRQEHTRDGEVKVIKGGSALEAPLILGRRSGGKIMLGEKLSGDLYTKEDVQLLKTFSYQAAVTLEKARLYEEVMAHSRMLEKRVQERTKELAELQEEQKQIMIDIAHGLQTPLTVLKGKFAFLEKKFGNSKQVRALEKSVDGVSTFIYDLLNLARLEESKEDFKKEEIRLSGLLDELVEYFSTLAEEKGIQIAHTIEPHISILGDKERISELIISLVSNAFKYMPPSGIKKIIITLRKVNRSAELTVEDTGIGIGKKDLPNIFKRFYRAERVGNTASKGTGLGLAIAKRIVEKHGGTIEVESQLGKGTAFTVRFQACE